MPQPSHKVQNLPPYIFSRIKALTLEAAKNNLDVIDLSMGNPDLPTPQPVIDRLIDTVGQHPKTHRYPQAKGMPKFRKAVSDWMKKRFRSEEHTSELQSLTNLVCRLLLEK